ncbi:TetR/AcrR family transcriptional regulator [Roseobacter sp. HKCCA0434]|uniref:TetR/AcrR family transcriptional regulator n=1 Tax=Roseobacter sp. HKCCA0434 TaxID=3079297 RepID=UPI002905F746|nr:TetR/AcrR family transcriptional regulator [Roseobacter sp. HKCCA0434]
MTKSRADKMAETRARLIAAGRAAFAQKGYAEASMDDFTGAAGLTRGALYHNFGGKTGLLQAVIEQIDGEMLARMAEESARHDDPWAAFLAEYRAYIRMALEPEIQRIVLLDGPAVLGDPSRWPRQLACLDRVRDLIAGLIEDGIVQPVDLGMAAALLNGAALNAALLVAGSDAPEATLPRALDTFERLAEGLRA